MRLRLACLFMTLVSIAAMAEPRQAKDSIVVSARLYPSGDFNAIVTAEVRRSELPPVDGAVRVSAAEGDRALALAFARLQMGTAEFRVDPVDGEAPAPSAAGVTKLRYKLSVRPWIVPTEETVERPLPSVLPGLVARTPRGPLVIEELTTIDIDEAYDLVVPADLRIETTFGVYLSTLDLTDGRLTVRRKLTLSPGSGPAARKDEAAAFLRAIADDVGTKVAIRRLEPPTPAQRGDGAKTIITLRNGGDENRPNGS